MRYTKRFISLLISLMLIVGSVSIPTLAATDEPSKIWGEDFSNYQDGYNFLGSNDWQSGLTSATNGISHSAKDDNGNMVGSVKYAATRSSNSYRIGVYSNAWPAVADTSDYVEISYRIKRTASIEVINVHWRNACYNNGDKNIVFYTDFKNGRIKARNTNSGFVYDSEYLYDDGMKSSSGWIDFKFIIDKSFNTYVYINDVYKGTWATNANGINKFPTGIYFQSDTVTASTEGELIIDDILQSQYTGTYAGGMLNSVPASGAESVSVSMTNAVMEFRNGLTAEPSITVESAETDVLPTGAATIDSTDKKKINITFTGAFDYNKTYTVKASGGTNELGGAVNGSFSFKTRDRQFIVGTPTYYRVAESETEISALETATVKAVIPVMNEFTSDREIFAVLASFSAGGEMTDVDYTVANLSSGNNDVSLTVDAVAAGELRLYTFDSVDSLKALAGEYSFTSSGLTSFADFAPTDAADFEPQVNYDVSPVTINISGNSAAEAGTLTSLILFPGKSKADLTEGNRSDATNIIEYIDQKNSSNGSYVFDIPSVTQGLDYVSYVSGVSEPKTFKYYNSTVISALFTAVQNGNKITLADMINGTTPFTTTPSNIYINDILGIDLTDYRALLDKPAAADAIDGVTYSRVEDLRNAIISSVAARKTYENERISIINDVNAKLWDELESYLESKDSILLLDWTGDYASLTDTTMFYKILADDSENTFATSGKTSDELIKAIRDTFAALATSQLTEQNQSSSKDDDDDYVYSGGGGGGGGGSFTISTPSKPSVSTPPVNNNASFNDLSNVPWAADAVNELVKRGVLNGVGANKFAPDDLVTREQFVKMLVLALNIPLSDSNAQFSDVNETDWFYQYVNAGYESGIVQGGNGVFGTGKPISRAEMATMCYRALKMLGYADGLSNEAVFADKGQIPEYALDAVAALADAEIINGVGDNMFAPFDSASRAQAAKIIWGIIEWIGGLK